MAKVGTCSSCMFLNKEIASADLGDICKLSRSKKVAKTVYREMPEISDEQYGNWQKHIGTVPKENIFDPEVAVCEVYQANPLIIDALRAQCSQ